jgi:hypothetical protein
MVNRKRRFHGRSAWLSAARTRLRRMWAEGKPRQPVPVGGLNQSRKVRVCVDELLRR